MSRARREVWRRRFRDRSEFVDDYRDRLPTPISRWLPETILTVAERQFPTFRAGAFRCVRAVPNG